MNTIQPGDMITIQVIDTRSGREAAVIRIEHKRGEMTLTPPTRREVYDRVLNPAHQWSKNSAGLPDIS